MNSFFTVPLLASDGGAKRFHLAILHDRWAHQVLPGPDSCFGLLKQKYCKSAVNTLQDLSNVVKQSAVTNKAEVVGWEDGIPLIPTYNWSLYFANHMTKVIGIKKFQHFHFDGTIRGKVQCRTVCDGERTTVELVKTEGWSPSSSVLPEIVKPKGLDARRQWYLYEKIRPFCTNSKDVTCPLPSCSKPAGSFNDHHKADQGQVTSSSNRAVSIAPSLSRPVSTPPTQPPPAKKRCICGKCGKADHNSRTCS